MIKFYFFITLTVSIGFIANALPVIEQRSPTQSGILPTSSPAFLPSFPYHGSTPLNPVPTGPIRSKSNLRKSSYPQPWTYPDVNHPEVRKAINAIDWNHVPNFAPRTMGMEYDEHLDEACWWTESQCTTPKVYYLPEDVKFCPNSQDFGLVRYIYQTILVVLKLAFFLDV